MTPTRTPGPLDDDADVHALIVEARRVAASAFPNPDRVGCPPDDALQASVRSGRLPSPELRAHLFMCSPCFQRFRTLLASQEANEAAVSVSGVPSRPGLFAWGRLGWIGALAACALLAGGAWLAWHQPLRVPASSGPAEAQPASSAGTMAPVPVVAMVLNDPIVFRGDPAAAPETASKPTDLPRGIVDVDVALPAEASAPTPLHSVVLVDAFDTLVARPISVSARPGTLRVRLDLSEVAPGRYALRVSRPEAPPHYATVVVHPDPDPRPR